MAGKFGPGLRDLGGALVHSSRTFDDGLPHLGIKHADHLAAARRRMDETDRDLAGSVPDAEAPPTRSEGRGIPDWITRELARDNLPFWRRRMLQGHLFNHQNYHRYPEREVRTANGHYLDSYAPDEEIVSRKFTQLGQIQERTAKGYLDEILRKYGPGTALPDGRTLEGEPILEVPVQDGPVPQAIIDYANDRKPPITIRDVAGTTYN